MFFKPSDASAAPSPTCCKGGAHGHCFQSIRLNPSVPFTKRDKSYLLFKVSLSHQSFRSFLDSAASHWDAQLPNHWHSDADLFVCFVFLVGKNGQEMISRRAVSIRKLLRFPSAEEIVSDFRWFLD
ncbi:hypothetical protein AVEN_268292-1 [Araneus ventricosus]|uniref:Uncharacterized protein n=1 Tax=Araneus ventricosus TaxID=182803 RepID=A0A4Y2C1K3_ARAVE|nr:hypothetical protein AVEN_268292-1 [Araneus ventricosus]